MKRYLITLLLLIPFVLPAQNEQIIKEQIAFDYFMTKIFPKDYIGFSSKSVFFSGLTESKKRIFLAGRCFDENFKNLFYKFKTIDTKKKLKIKTNSFRFSKRKRNKYFDMKIFRSMRHKGYDYVYLSLYKKNKHYRDHYTIKIKDGNVVDFCYRNEVF